VPEVLHSLISTSWNGATGVGAVGVVGAPGHPVCPLII